MMGMGLSLIKIYFFLLHRTSFIFFVAEGWSKSGNGTRRNFPFVAINVLMGDSVLAGTMWYSSLDWPLV